MKATIAVVRAYGSARQHGEHPRQAPPGSPITLPGFPKRPWFSSVTLGEPVPWVLDAVRVRRVFAKTALTGDFGRAQTGRGPRDQIDQMLLDPTVGPNADDWDWWTTITCEREVDLPDDEWAQMPFIWISWPRAEELARDARRDIGGVIDLIAASVYGTVPNVIDSGPVVDGVCFRRAGKTPFELPTATLGQVSVSVTTPPDRIDLSRLSRQLRRSRPALQTLHTAVYWWARAIEEPDDRSRFIFQFAALEILTNRLARAAQEAVLPQLRYFAFGETSILPAALTARVDGDLAGRFALTALLLAPTTATEDTRAFEELKRMRDGVAHGGVDLDTALPSADRLLSRYLPLALAYLAHGQKPRIARGAASQDRPSRSGSKAGRPPANGE